MDFKAKAKEIEEYVIGFRRDLHRHPEASFQEFRTTGRIAEELDKLGIPYRRFEPTGLLGEIKGAKPGKTVALRADIDALSIQELTDVPYASENAGFMHACGHDTHAAMLLGAARILNGMKEDLCGTVKLLFQPAEELAQGAKAVLKQGGLDGADAAFGMHIFAQMPAGALAVAEGVVLPAADMYKLKVTGKATHGALPEKGMDATVAAAAIVMNLQTIVSRELNPLDPVVVTVGSLHSGSRFNIISGEAVMEGTVRIFNKEAHRQIPGIMERIAKETAAAFRCTAELEYNMMVEALENDAALAALARQSALKVLPSPAMLLPFTKTMGAEDFADYTPNLPCTFVALGGGGEYPQHSDHFFIEEDALKTGTALYAQMAVDYLND